MGVGVSVSSGVGVRVGSGVSVSVGVGMGVSDGVLVNVSVDVKDGVWVKVGVKVGVKVSVCVGVKVGVFVGVRVGVKVRVGGRGVLVRKKNVGVEVLVMVLVTVMSAVTCTRSLGLRGVNITVGAAMTSENATTVWTTAVFKLATRNSTMPTVGVPARATRFISLTPIAAVPHSRLTPSTAATSTQISGRYSLVLTFSVSVSCTVSPKPVFPFAEDLRSKQIIPQFRCYGLRD